MSNRLPPAFQQLSWSNLLAQLAEQLSLAATPIVAVLLLQAGPGDIGLLASVQSLPFLLLAIPMGLLADRIPRRALMLWAEILRASALLVLVGMLLAGQVSLPMLALTGFLAAVGTVAFSVAAPSLVPALVAGHGLARANGRLELARSTAYAAGPALAGALIGWTGATSAFVLSGMLSVAAAACLWGLREPARAPMAARHPLLDLKEGAWMVWRHPLLRPIMFTSVFWNLAWFMLQATYVPYAIKVMGLDAQGVGLTLGAYGVGMVVGALLASRAVAHLQFGHAILVGPAISVLAAGAMAATLFWPHANLAAASYFLFGAGPMVWTITSMTLRQTVTPQRMIGRVSSINLVASLGVRPLGAALGGWVGVQWSVSVSLWCVLAGFVVQACIITLSPVRRLKQLPQAAADD
jgi:predicted MFS family arabinose efflux permease